MSKKIIYSDKAPMPIGPYSQAVLVRDTLYVSGQIALDLAEKGDVAAETNRILENIGHILKAAGMNYSHVVKSTIFLKNMDDFGKVNEVYGTFFSQKSVRPPQRNLRHALVAVTIVSMSLPSAINQQKATIDTIIHDGDNITITKGVDGTSPEMTIGEFIGEPTPITIYFNQKEQHLSPRIFVNQKKVGADYLLQDGDQVSFKQQFKVQDVLKDNRIDKDINNSFIIWVNNEQMLLEDYSKKLVINGKPASKEQSIKNGDRIDLISNDHPLLEDILLKLNIPTEKTITVTYNHEPLVLTKSFIKVSRNGKAIEKNARINDQDKLEVTELKEEPFLFQDLFRHISLDLANVKGKVILRKNGEKVSFLDELKANDEIEIILD